MNRNFTNQKPPTPQELQNCLEAINEEQHFEKQLQKIHGFNTHFPVLNQQPVESEG
eukprot:CAMPEP_0170510740 /NCGR_PEP_ID=MMETSP0208-20121228/65928_1 /TAXON_ID=197538 /ORGANISM="Strombidium inclinatum, Strain S3" /LENGTH=55 /DNA_ID=CAMNT_0010794227 /DNA_START=9 /DNA_END=176 /DNA_ORIENTATION=-